MRWVIRAISFDTTLGMDNGLIEARDGASYRSCALAMPYSVGTLYHFRLGVDFAARTYSTYVTEDAFTVL